MDKQYSVKFFTSFVEAMQKFCREYIDFEQCVELSGYLAVEIDNHKKERYVLSEMLQSSGNVISESYCTKAFKTLRKEPSSGPPRGSENIPHKIGPRTAQSHAEEVTIVLRDSPEIVSHATHSSVPRHQTFSSQRSGAFSHGQRGYSSSGLGSPVHMRESIKLGNPFDQQLRHVPNQIQPRPLDSSTRNNSTFSSPSSSAHKRAVSELNHQQESPASKRDKPEVGSSSTQGDISSMRNVYSGVSDTGESSLIQQTTASTVSFPSPSSSQSTSEIIRLPLSATVKEEHVSSVISLETSDDTQEHTTESDFDETLQESLSLGMDTSAAYSNNSQGGTDDTTQSTSGYMSQFKMAASITCTETFPCLVCGKSFSEYRYLKQHSQTHISERFSCQFCGSTYSMKSNLCRHLRKCKHQLTFDREVT